MTKSYSELSKLPTFKERFEYLQLKGKVGHQTFGSKRYLNQMLYHIAEWKQVKRKVIIRDNGCDLGIEGREIHGPISVHHINPITEEDILKRSPKVFDMDNLISTSYMTHKAIHYSNIDLLQEDYSPRELFDTCPWKRGHEL